MRNALNPKLSCSCQEDVAADVASDPAAADVAGCSPPAVDSAAATVSDSQHVPLATASDFPRRPGDTRRQEAVKKLGVSDSITLLRESWMPVHCTCDE
jgi:hypothetical protein